MPLSEKKKASNKRWIDQNYTQVKFAMPNREAEALNSYCATNELTKAGFIRAAIKAAIAANLTEFPDQDNQNKGK